MCVHAGHEHNLNFGVKIFRNSKENDKMRLERTDAFSNIFIEVAILFSRLVNLFIEASVDPTSL
jgi:hypothetical protein